MQSIKISHGFKHKSLSLLVGAALAIGASAAQAAYSVTGLPTAINWTDPTTGLLDTQTFTWSGLNNAGQVLGFSNCPNCSDPSQPTTAQTLLWQGGASTELFINGVSTAATGRFGTGGTFSYGGGSALSNNGKVASQTGSGAGGIGQYWNVPVSGATGGVNFGGAQSTYQNTVVSVGGINNAGTIAGATSAGATQQAYNNRAAVWTSGSTAPVLLPNPNTAAPAAPSATNSPTSAAFDINNNGYVVGYAKTAGTVVTSTTRTHATVWTHTGAAVTTSYTSIDLGLVGAAANVHSLATAINDSNVVVGFGSAVSPTAASSGRQAAVWTPNGAGYNAATAITLAGFTFDSVANDINSLGQVVGTAKSSATTSTAFLYDSAIGGGAAVDLNSLLDATIANYWTLTSAIAINDQGWVLGQGIFDADGVGGNAGINSWYIAQAVPEPETWGMLAAGLGLLGFNVRRRRASGQEAA
jgi:probable HAF family extracellular repeat protein